MEENINIETNLGKEQIIINEKSKCNFSSKIKKKKKKKNKIKFLKKKKKKKKKKKIIPKYIDVLNIKL